MKSITADKLPNMHSTEYRGIPVVIQWPKGSTRVGEHDDGTPFKTEMKADYGYIPDTVAVGDGERLDVYIGTDKESENVYVIEQVKKSTGELDEYKVMLGFDSLEAAEEMYEYHIGDNSDKELGEISEVPFEYLFNRVGDDREEVKEDEVDNTRSEIEADEDKVGRLDKLKARRDPEGKEKWSDSEQKFVNKDADHETSLIDAFVKVYKHEHEYFERVAEEVSDQLTDILQEAGIKAAVTFRAKKPRKLKAKLLKRDQEKQYQSFQDIYDDIVDLAGVRVALYLPADREAVGQIIEQHFTLMRTPKHFPKDKAPDDVIGYVATHYLVRLKPETLHKDEYQYADTNVELQVASVLMHAWAEVTHDLLYKPDKGALAPEEVEMIHDLNRIVQEGEATLEKLQQSVENRQHTDLRFELMAKLASRLGLQSKGRATRRITANDVKAVAKQGRQPSPMPHVSYLKAKLALWKAHNKI